MKRRYKIICPAHRTAERKYWFYGRAFAKAVALNRLSMAANSPCRFIVVEVDQ